MHGSTRSNIIAGVICMFSIINLANTSNIQGTIYSAEDNVLKTIAPITNNYVDNTYLGGLLKESTENVLSIPPIHAVCDAWNTSGAANVIGNVFRPMIEGYQGLEFSDAVEHYGLYFDEETGQYVLVDDGSEADDASYDAYPEDYTPEDYSDDYYEYDDFGTDLDMIDL